MVSNRRRPSTIITAEELQAIYLDLTYHVFINILNSLFLHSFKLHGAYNIIMLFTWRIFKMRYFLTSVDAIKIINSYW